MRSLSLAARGATGDRRVFYPIGWRRNLPGIDSGPPAGSSFTYKRTDALQPLFVRHICSDNVGRKTPPAMQGASLSRLGMERSNELARTTCRQKSAPHSWRISRPSAGVLLAIRNAPRHRGNPHFGLRRVGFGMSPMRTAAEDLADQVGEFRLAKF
jgi:hypothetical protein